MVAIALEQKKEQIRWGHRAFQERANGLWDWDPGHMKEAAKRRL